MSNFSINLNGDLLKFKRSVNEVYDNNNNALDLNQLVQSYKLTVISTLSTGTELATINDDTIYFTEQDTYSHNAEGLVWFDTFADLVNYGSQYLSHGNFVATKGYYSVNDGGGAFYNILNSPTKSINGITLEDSVELGYGRKYSLPLVDGYTLINIGTEDTPLYADLLLMNGCAINIRLLGARPLEDGVKIDNAPYLGSILRNFIKRKRYVTRVFIPAGHWCTTAVSIYNAAATYVSLKICGEGMHNTILMPYDDSQTYIIRMGTSYEAGTCSRGSVMHDLTFLCGKAELTELLLSLYGDDKYVTDCALKMYGTYYDAIYNISFLYVYNTCLKRIYSFEALSRNIRFYCCGATRNGTTYPITVWDDTSITGPSSLSANWVPYMHFDSCIGPFIYGASQNNFTHNEFGTIMVTGSADNYYAVSPDLNVTDSIPDYTTSGIVKWGILSGNYGSGSNWPNMYGTIMINSLDNWATRTVNDATVYYRLTTIYTRLLSTDNENANKFDVSRVVASGTVYYPSSNVYFGNIAFPNIQETYTNGGPYIGYNSTTDNGGKNIWIKLLFNRTQKPIYSKNSFPHISIPNFDNRLISNVLTPTSYNNSRTGAESPFSTTTSTPANGSFPTILMKAGTLYGIRYVGSGNYVSGFNAGYHLGGLMIYKDGSWQNVVNLNQVPYGTIDYGSSTYLYKYANIPAIYFQEDTLVRVGGSGLDFFYERLYKPSYKLNFEYISGEHTPNSGTSVIYKVTSNDSEVTNYSIASNNSSLFTATYDEATNYITVNAKTNNSNGLPNCSNIIVTGLDSNSNIVTKASLLTSLPSVSMKFAKKTVVKNLEDSSFTLDAPIVYYSKQPDLELPKFSTLTNSSFTWRTSNLRVAAVGNTTGVVTLVGVGTVTITCKYSGLETTCEIICTNTEISFDGEFETEGEILSGSGEVSLTAGTLYDIWVMSEDSGELTLDFGNDSDIIKANNKTYYYAREASSSFTLLSNSLKSCSVTILKSSTTRYVNPVNTNITGLFGVYLPTSYFYVIDLQGNIQRSKNLVTWEASTGAPMTEEFISRLQSSYDGSESGYNILSLFITKLSDVYNIYTSSSNGSSSWIGVSQSSTITTGPYEFSHSIINSSSNDVLNPIVFTGEDGVWMIYGTNTLKLANLDSDGLSIQLEVTLLTGNDNLRCGSVIYKNDYWYIFTYTDSAIYVSKAESLYNVFLGEETLEECPEPLLVSTTNSKGLRNPRMCNYIHTNDSDSNYMFFIADYGENSTGLCVQYMYWGDEWPILKNISGVEKLISLTIGAPTV